MTRRLFIAMQPDRRFRMVTDVQVDESMTFSPRNGRMYNTAGLARNYSSYETRASHNRKLTRVFDGHVLIVDLDALPRVTFDAKGKAIGIAAEKRTPTLLEEYENAERMIEIWAKRAEDLRAQLGATPYGKGESR